MKSWEHKTEAAKPEGSTSESVVLITGGTRGIGRAIALRLARATPRHIVLAYCLDHQAARNTLEEIKGMGVSASVMVCDVGQEKLQREMFQQVEETWGRLDVFVANAARTAFQSAETLPTRSFRRTMELNAEAFLVGAQLAAAVMKKNGKLINWVWTKNSRSDWKIRLKLKVFWFIRNLQPKSNQGF